MASIVSPITLKNNVELICKFKTIDIINLYKRQFRADVSRFFTGLETIDLYRCKDTNYRFFYPGTISGDGRFYKELQIYLESEGTGYYRGECYDHIFAYQKIEQGQELLEIGCGSGIFLEKMQQLDINAYGLELNTLAVANCVEKGLKVKNELLADHALYNSGRYDIVCAFQVLEHVADAGPFIADSLKCLKKGGKLILSVPNSEPYFARFNKYETLNLPPHHIGLWNLDAFIKTASFFDLKINSYCYSDPTKNAWLTDAYFKAKHLMRVKSLRHEHTYLEKALMFLAMIITVPYSFVEYNAKAINPAFIVVEFIK